MPTTFNLTIALGNEAMQTNEDVADALRRLADKLADPSDVSTTIRDLNGNKVGRWSMDRPSLP